jgi:ribonucleoside-diphosphate reductase alpha chain
MSDNVASKKENLSEFKYGPIKIIIDQSRSSRLTNEALQLLKKFYLRENESVQEGLARAACAWSQYNGVYDQELAQRIYGYASKGWYGNASPVLSNAPAYGKKLAGWPISCFGQDVGDRIKDLVPHLAEFCYLSVAGGGSAGHWSKVRSMEEKGSPGIISFLLPFDKIVSAYKQQNRRGSYAAYLSVQHPEIAEFINMRLHTGGDEKRKCFSEGFHNAVNIPDDFMEKVANDESWDLIDPHYKSVVKTISARQLWEDILEISRKRSGEPYLFFIDTANAALPQAQQDLGLKVNGSNLCSEITLPTGIDFDGMLRTFVCCLSSINLAKRDEWIGEIDQFVGDLITMLDNIIQIFVDNAPDTMANAKYSAMRERALGLGTMGIHTYLQMKSLPWDSCESVELDGLIHSQIKKAAVKRSRELAIERGEAPDMKGTGLRNSHLMALAPCANNASIVGVSHGIEQLKDNGYVHGTRAGSHLVKNEVLAELLKTKYEKDTPEVWSEIITSGGSVQQLEWMDEHDKNVFKTAMDTNQMWTVQHAAARQPSICQAQSLNLHFPSNATRKEVSDIHRAAWHLKLKSLYYFRTTTTTKVEKISAKVERVSLSERIETEDCVSCQG